MPLRSALFTASIPLVGALRQFGRTRRSKAAAQPKRRAMRSVTFRQSRAVRATLPLRHRTIPALPAPQRCADPASEMACDGDAAVPARFEMASRGSVVARTEGAPALGRNHGPQVDR